MGDNKLWQILTATWQYIVSVGAFLGSIALTQWSLIAAIFAGVAGGLFSLASLYFLIRDKRKKGRR